MNMYYVSFFVAVAFGLYASYLFLKASGLYAQYRDSVKRRSRGETLMSSWKFIVPINKYEGESIKMGDNRKMHDTYIKRYYIMMVGMAILLVVAVYSTK